MTKIQTAEDYFKNLSTKDFMSFGLRDIAYTKPITVDGEQAWALHSADGRVIAVQETQDHAIILARQNELEPVTLH